MSSHEDYKVDQTLSLTRLPHKSDLPSPTIRVRIQELKTRSMSCTMTVDIETDTDGGGPTTTTGFLKLYDRRFADGQREQEGVGAWTPAIEDAYTESVRSGTIHQFVHDLHHVEKLQIYEMDFSYAQAEAYIAHLVLEQYTAEIAVYDALRDHQGKAVPRLLAAVDLDLSPPGAEDELFHIKGILLEFIEGFPMSQLSGNVPQSAWQNIVDQGIAAVHVLGDHYIMDEDRRPLNFMVSPEKDGEFRVFMIDFGCCRFKRDDESEEEWASNKITMDEEGAVGLLMRKWLAKDHGFNLHYEPSSRYLEVGLEYARALARADREHWETRKAEAKKKAEAEKAKAEKAKTIAQAEA
jgi:predicted protein tyrosine phosphatase